MKKLLLLLLFLSALNAESFYYQNGKKVFLKPSSKQAPALRQKTGDIMYYENAQGQELGLKNQILIKVEEDVDVSALAHKYDLLFIKALSSSIYLLETKNGDDVFEKAALLYEDKQTLLAQPNFSRKRVLR